MAIVNYFIDNSEIATPIDVPDRLTPQEQDIWVDRFYLPYHDAGLAAAEKDPEHPLSFLPDWAARGAYRLAQSANIVQTQIGMDAETNAKDIEKVVVCKRYDTIRQAESMYDLSRLDIEIVDENKLDCPFADVYRDMTMQDIHNKMGLHNFMVDKWVEDTNILYLNIYFEDMLSKPKETIKNLVHFLDIGEVDITEAVDNVDER